MCEENEIQVTTTTDQDLYINLSKKLLKERGEIKLSAVGYIATGNAIKLSEILKYHKLARIKDVATSIMEFRAESTGRTISKVKLEILMVKTLVFEERIAKENMNDGSYSIAVQPNALPLRPFGRTDVIV